jgi:hypothetical protein
VAVLGMALLWRLFRDLKTDAHGVFFNLQTLKSNPLLVPICQKRKIRKKVRLTGWKPSPAATSA